MNKDLYDTELMSYNSKTGEYEWVTPRVMTNTVYNDKGENLDDLLKFTPSDLKEILYEILDGAPEAYNSFKEVADALDKNKNSISEIFNEIARRVKKPQTGSPGQVLKLNESGEIIFADDKDTVYEHPKKHKPWEIETDENNQFVSDEEKTTWDSKLDETSEISKNTVYFNKSSINQYGEITRKSERVSLARALLILSEDTAKIKAKKDKAYGYASLDEKRKVPINQLPAEALKDTTYNLSSYAKNEVLKNYKLADGTTKAVLKAQGEVDANDIREEWFFAHYKSINTPVKGKGWYINTMNFNGYIFQVAYDGKEKKKFILDQENQVNFQNGLRYLPNLT